MINLGEKMVFASGTRQRGSEFSVTKRAAKRSDSTYDPEHQQREARLNVCQLKTETREDTGADDVRNHDRARRYEPNRTPGRCRLNGSRLRKCGHPTTKFY